jgi:hypothetical protein
LIFRDVISRGVSRRDMERFHGYYYRLDPFMKRFPPPTTILIMDQLAPAKTLCNGEYYNDFLRPQAIHHQMTMAVKAAESVVGVVAMKTDSRDVAELARALMGLFEYAAEAGPGQERGVSQKVCQMPDS